MVCIPCIILPLALWVYCKFLQPLILRWLPVTWRVWLDSWLYPTCPVKPPSATAIGKNGTSVVSNVASNNAGSVVGEQIGDGSTVDGQELTRRNVGVGVGVGGDEGSDKIGGKQNGTSCCDEQNTPLATLQSKGQIVVGASDKKTE